MTKTRERTRRTEKPKGRLLKALADKSAGACRSSGRNSLGRITSFHRGGGSKRIHRKVDLKREVPATGVVERVEYDSTRSSRVALVRWIDGFNGLIRSGHVAPSAHATSPPAGEVLESPSVSSSFSLASLPGTIGQSVVNQISSSQAKTLPKDYVLIGGVPNQTCIRQGPGKIEAESPPLSFNFLRIAIAGAKPSFFAPRAATGEELVGKNVSFGEIQRWKNGSMDSKSAIPWQSSGLLDVLRPKLDKGGNLLPTQVISHAFSPNAHRTLNGNNNSSSSLLAKTIVGSKGLKDCVPVSYIIASDKLKEGDTVMNCDWSKLSSNSDSSYERLDLNSQVGNCIPLKDIRMGTWVHDVEVRPGQGAKLVRAAGTYAKVVKEQDSKCLVRLPSGVEKLIDSNCRATIGVVSNLDHGARKLRKAGHSRWLGRRPVVRGVAMNPIDHPHGGGEGRTSGGRPSVSPWGKPTKGGFKTVLKVVGKGRV